MRSLGVKEWLATKKGKVITAILLAACILTAVLSVAVLNFSGKSNNTNSLNTQEKVNNTLITNNTSNKSEESKGTDGTQDLQGTEASENSDETDENSSEGSTNADGQAGEKSANSGQTYVPSSVTALKVSGTQLTDSEGNPVILRGISTHGLSWFPEYVNAESFSQLHEQWGINCIRLAMYTADYNGYCTGDSSNKQRLKSLIDEGVGYASQNNMYVIIDWHILSDNNPNTYLSEAKEFFAEMSAKYAGYDNVLYEICNEPNGGTSWSQIKAYAQEVIPVIRENDSDAVIIVGTPNWSQYVGDAADNPITGYDNIMYALHFYAATHTDSLRNAMVSAIKKGLPIFVSEYGICDASGNGGIDEYQANEWIRVMNEYGVSHIAWNLSNKSETSAIIKSSCSKTSGWDYEELSDSGKWLYNMLNSDAEYGTWEGNGSADNAEDTSDSEENSDNASQNTDNSGNSGTSGDTGVSDNMLENAPYDMQLQSSWASDGRNYYLYNITVTNSGSDTITAWSVTISFDKAMTLTDSWNGDYTAQGNTLTIISKDYNGTLTPGSSTGNIGFIVHD